MRRAARKAFAFLQPGSKLLSLGSTRLQPERIGQRQCSGSVPGEMLHNQSSPKTAVKLASFFLILRYMNLPATLQLMKKLN